MSVRVKVVIEKGLLLEMWFKMNVRANHREGEDSPSNFPILSSQDFILSSSIFQFNSSVGGRKSNLQELSLRWTRCGSRGTGLIVDGLTSNKLLQCYFSVVWQVLGSKSENKLRILSLL